MRMRICPTSTASPGSTPVTRTRDATAADDARDIATYLAGLKGDLAAAPEGNVADGEKLYGKLGCVACHHFEDAKKVDERDRYPLGVARAQIDSGQGPGGRRTLSFSLRRARSSRASLRGGSGR